MLTLSHLGLASFGADYLPQVTWEGDSYMLTQQLGRYLFKTFRVLLANPDAPMSKENRTRTYVLKAGSQSLTFFPTRGVLTCSP